MDIDGKLRPLYLLRILKERTDEDHSLSTAQLCRMLKDDYGIETFRTTIKGDIEVLQQAGFSIQATRSTQNLYNYIRNLPGLHIWFRRITAAPKPMRIL